MAKLRQDLAGFADTDEIQIVIESDELTRILQEAGLDLDIKVKCCFQPMPKVAPERRVQHLFKAPPAHVWCDAQVLLRDVVLDHAQVNCNLCITMEAKANASPKDQL